MPCRHRGLSAQHHAHTSANESLLTLTLTPEPHQLLPALVQLAADWLQRLNMETNLYNVVDERIFEHPVQSDAVVLQDVLKTQKPEH